jgi:sugar/nucleoside kinase (ribokinase family)
MSFMADTTPRHLVIGPLRRMFLLPPKGPPRLDTPGGNLLYAAAGLRLWETDIGLVSRVGEDYPRTWLTQIEDHGFDTEGINILPEALDLRQFMAYSDLHTRHTDNPVAHFARRELQFPKTLFGYNDPNSRSDSRDQLTAHSLRKNDIPADFHHATAAHFCPLDYLTHSLVPALLRQSGFTTLTLDPSHTYMNPNFYDQVPAIVTGLTAFMPSEDKVRALFRGRTEDLWEMAETLATFGCEIIVIKRAIRGQLLYDAGSKERFEIPAYPGREVDLTGAGDSFCGGFLAGWRTTFEPVQAALYGNVSASLTIEGSGPFYPLEALPGLAEARLEVLKQSIRKV